MVISGVMMYYSMLPQTVVDASIGLFILTSFMVYLSGA